MLTDPIADMITRIRNALMRSKPFVTMPHSRLKMEIAQVLLREGYIKSVEKIQGEGQDQVKSNLQIFLKYHNGTSTIRYLKRISKPSLQKYTSIKDLKPVANGLGISILSTNAGVLSDREAKEKKTGGKILVAIH